MYYERLPAYEYDLPCGRTFRSLTRSVPYRRKHYFPCISCRAVHEVKEDDLIETRPGSARKALGDMEVAVRIDSAIQADRVREYYRSVWSAQSVLDVARTLGVSKRIVARVSLDLGVYRDAEDCAAERCLSATDSVSSGER